MLCPQAKSPLDSPCLRATLQIQSAQAGRPRERKGTSETVLTGLNRLRRDRHVSQRCVLGGQGRCQRAGVPRPAWARPRAWRRLLGDTFLGEVIPERKRRNPDAQRQQRIPGTCDQVLKNKMWGRTQTCVHGGCARVRASQSCVTSRVLYWASVLPSVQWGQPRPCLLRLL